MAWCPLDNKIEQAFNRTHGDKDKARHLATMITSRKPDEKCIGQNVAACV